MPPKLGHKKSRRGCLSYKKRRVKCDEETPRSACVRHSSRCSLVDELEPASRHGSQPAATDTSRDNIPQGGFATRPDPLPYLDKLVPLESKSQHDESWVTDLELMHHYTAFTCRTLPQSNDHLRIWQIEVPKSGHSYPFVMHQILALAALHLGYLGSGNRHQQRYALDASQHQIKAVSGIRKSIAHVINDNCEALFAASTLLIISAYASFPRTKDWLEDSGTPCISDILGIFSLIRGMNAILDIGSNHALHNGTFAPSFQREPMAESMPILESLLQQVELFRIQISSYRYADTLSREIEVLVHWIRRCSATMTQPERRITMTWPIDMSTEYISLLRRRDAASLALLAHHCVVV
ncbi:hypothetical protein FDECE_259 [Fusarium decemcellulare]|nr:hypothetical protein FDECE_259 [Fusarium decemcellulare]